MKIVERKANGKKQTVEIGYYKKDTSIWWVKLYGKVIHKGCSGMGARDVCCFLDGWFGKPLYYTYDKYFTNA